jgi:hypothetical protein
MEGTEKTVVYVGGGLIAAWLLFSFIRAQRQQQLAELNQPGLISQPGLAVNKGLSQVILAASGGLSDAISGAYQNSGSGLNDPGLESDESTDWQGADYSYEQSNSYASSYDIAASGD